MLRKTVFVLLALALPLFASSAAGAQQYPPTGEEPAATTAPGDTPTETGGAPLARTGSEVTPLVAVSVVLLAGGAVALLVSRRRGAASAA